MYKVMFKRKGNNMWETMRYKNSQIMYFPTKKNARGY